MFGVDRGARVQVARRRLMNFRVRAFARALNLGRREEVLGSVMPQSSAARASRTRRTRA